jgi:hypothetical protein
MTADRRRQTAVCGGRRSTVSGWSFHARERDDGEQEQDAVNRKKQNVTETWNAGNIHREKVGDRSADVRTDRTRACAREI